MASSLFTPDQLAAMGVGHNAGTQGGFQANQQAGNGSGAGAGQQTPRVILQTPDGQPVELPQVSRESSAGKGKGKGGGGPIRSDPAPTKVTLTNTDGQPLELPPAPAAKGRADSSRQLRPPHSSKPTL